MKIKIFNIFLIINILFFNGYQNAKEVLIYADNISYDENDNLIAKGNVKVISENRIIQSKLIIYNKIKEIYILPVEFNFKDERNNFYFGSSGYFTSDLDEAEINDSKILLSDGSRIVGSKTKRKGSLDIISKGSYSSCSSRIKIKSFQCPIWQLDGEKIIHDSKNLILYQKHSKMKIFNIPVLYLPYLVTPSPLRKKRKSGFLNPSLSFNFINTETPQTIKLPYYFNIDIDKELTFTPIINYGGGTSSKQRMLFDYNQIISGGNFNFDISTDTTINENNSSKWFSDASLIVDYDKNINETYNIKANSALQTTQTYLRSSDPNNLYSSNTSLSSSIKLNGYGVLNNNDILYVNTTTYQVVQANEDNRTTPTSLPYINYSGGFKKYKKLDYENNYQFYNIFREISTTDHAQKQIKLAHSNATFHDFYNLKSKFTFQSEIHTQIFNTENKKIGSKDFNNNYFRLFPMTGLKMETPMKNNKYNFYIYPKVSIIVNSGQSNSGKISNEDSTNNHYTISKQLQLNRYTGTDKLDNSKRINYSIGMEKNKFNFNLSQNYEFSKNSNYHKESGNNDYLSDILGTAAYNSEKNLFSYNIRYDLDHSDIKKQYISYENKNKLGEVKINYLDEKIETNSILTSGNEQASIKITSNKFKKYNKLNLDTKYNLITNRLNEYKVGYSYFDECFGISFDYKRLYYEQGDLKPTDNLTLMFSFKNLGSYKSTNLAVSELDKQDVEWEGVSVDNDAFY